MAILPLLMTLAVPPEKSSGSLPDITSSAEILWVVAIKAAASITEFSPNTTPLPLMISNLPVALTCPRIIEGSVPITLFAVTAEAEGWMKSTRSFVPTEKLSHSIKARSDDWVMVS